MPRIPLGPIEAFIAVARSGSLVQAAAAMHLTVPAISRRLRLLEQQLGVRLFDRQPRGVALTASGTAYLAQIGSAWDSIVAATEAARDHGRDGCLRVSVMPTFAANWLVPRLSRFQARHKDIAIELETSADIIDLNQRADLDAAIRLGQGRWPGLQSRLFLPVDATPVAAPTLLRGQPKISEPADLLGQTLIETAHQPAFWQEWFAARHLAPTGMRYLRFDNLQLVYEAASAGMGIAMGLSPLVRPFLTRGSLQAVFPHPVRLSRGFYLVRRTADPAPDRSFLRFAAWLQAEADAACVASG